MIQSIRAKLRALLTGILRVLVMPLATSVPALTLRVVKEKPAIKAAVDHGPLTSSSVDSEHGINPSNVSHRRSAERAGEILAFETPDDSISVKWLETGISRESPVTSSSQVDMPKAPDAFYPVDPCFMTAMIEASQTTSAEESHFAMDCIRLRGVDGRIAVCDSCQAFTLTGFRFPWCDEVLVVSPRIPSPDLLHAKHVEIGRTNAWFFVRLEQQTLTLRIEKERLFSHLDLPVPTRSPLTTKVQLSPRDATFLALYIPISLDVKAHRAPVTVELNRVVAIRVVDEGKGGAVELVLDDSRYFGDSLRTHTDPSQLLRAIDLGFHNIHLWGALTPVLCRNRNRTYLWALLRQEGSIPASEGMSKIHSLNKVLFH